MIDRYARMREVPLQEVELYCEKCPFLRDVYKAEKEGRLTLFELGEFRKTCTNCCRYNEGSVKLGIYKADAIFGWYKVHEFRPKGKGRKRIIPEKTLQAIRRQVQEGIKYREISKRTGYSISTISRIVNGK